MELLRLWPFAAAELNPGTGSIGVEVDLLLEAPDGRIVGIEVEAAPGVTTSATRGLVHLRDRLGDRFVNGLVLNTGNEAQRIGDRLCVAPIRSLWS